MGGSGGDSDTDGVSSVGEVRSTTTGRLGSPTSISIGITGAGTGAIGCECQHRLPTDGSKDALPVSRSHRRQPEG